jgi:CDP-diacylglycerol--glycerol-3-phosphate 3-phosphatidyltransferase
LALLAVILAIVSDWADGWSARRMGYGSDFGKLFDPAADAFFFVAAALGLALAGIIPWWLALPFVVREMVQHAYVRPTALRLGVAMGAKFIGKLKTSVQAGAMIMVAAIEIVRVHADLYVALIRTDVLFVWLDWAQWLGVGIAATLSVASIVPYVLHLRRLRAEGAA